MKNNYIKVERKINQGMIAPMNGLPLKYLFFFLKSDKENILKKGFFSRKLDVKKIIYQM